MRGIRRLAFEELEATLAGALRPRYERLGYLGEFFSVMAHQPSALRAFDAFTEECKDALPADLLEIVALTVACRLGNDYERCQHEQLCLRLGFVREWVEDVERIDPERAVELTPKQLVAQRFVVTAVDTVGRSAGEPLADMVMRLGTPVAVAVVLATARYLAHAMISNACELTAPVPSIFELDEDGN